MRIAVAGIFHETNSFAPGKTPLDAFKADWVANRDDLMAMYGGTGTSLGGVIDALQAEHAEPVMGFYAGATPSGMIEAPAAEALLELVTASVDPAAEGRTNNVWNRCCNRSCSLGE
jgi:microcystin degradation protein MlrC